MLKKIKHSEKLSVFHKFYLVRSQRTKFALRKIFIKLNSAHLSAFKLDNSVACGGKHSLDLMIFTLADFDFNKRIFAALQNSELGRQTLGAVL